jgi:hypothetical protein
VKDPTDAMGDVLTPASRVVSAERHRVLLERVAKLEQALETIAFREPSSGPDYTPNIIARDALSD